MVTVKVPWEPELLDPWKAAWDRLIWKATIPKVKAIEGELNRNPLHLCGGDLRRSDLSVLGIGSG
jgi:hypothetical protein